MNAALLDALHAHPVVVAIPTVSSPLVALIGADGVPETVKLHVTGGFGEGEGEGDGDGVGAVGESLPHAAPAIRPAHNATDRSTRVISLISMDRPR